MPDTPFYPKKSKEVLGYNLHALLDIKGPMVKGDVGLEIEVEGNKFQKDKDMIPLPWTYHKDGSLRGHDNAEYVLKGPVPFKDVPKVVNTLWRMFDDYGSKLDISNRTSVHVHLNAQRWHLHRLTAFLALYFSVEEMLTEWCGDHRVGNLFCLRAKDATAIVTVMKKFIMQNGCYPLNEGLHYAGLNTQALCKFGSLEIRTLRGATEPKTIIDWVAILERIYTLSEQYKDPRELPGMLSSEGAMNYLEYVLGEHTSTIRGGIGWTVDRIRDSLYEGIRLAQDLCFCRDWDLYKPVDVQPDPFGRSLKKVNVGSLINVAAEQAMHQMAVAGLNTQAQWASYSTSPTPYPAPQAAIGVPPDGFTIPSLEEDDEDDTEDYASATDDDVEPEEDVDF